jgi:DNA-binding GntR family transcriptional regulator
MIVRNFMQKIEPKAIHETAAAQIREMIWNGILAKGQKIDEKNLCESMGVSRTPIRESLRMLNAEGLVRLIPNKGAYVNDPSVEAIKDMFEVMSVLEGMCARLAAKKMTDNDFNKIELLHRELEKYYIARDHRAYLDCNNTFHVFIEDLAGNKVLEAVIGGLRKKILLYRYWQLYQGDRFDKSIHEHRVILEAFRKRDAELAENAMKQHLLRQCEALVDGPMLA